MKLETWQIDSVTYLLCKEYKYYAIWWAGCRCTPWETELDKICNGELLDQCGKAIEQLGDHGKYPYKCVECVTADDPFGTSHEIFLGLE